MKYLYKININKKDNNNNNILKIIKECKEYVNKIKV